MRALPVSVAGGVDAHWAVDLDPGLLPNGVVASFGLREQRSKRGRGALNGGEVIFSGEENDQGSIGGRCTVSLINSGEDGSSSMLGTRYSMEDGLTGTLA